MAGEEISNYWIVAKKAGKGVMGVGGTAISAAQYLTGTGTLALATGAAAASATGIGLVVAGAAITVTTCGLSGYSAYKTGKHVKVLENIYERRRTYQCQALPGAKQSQADHNQCCDEILPYIILQKVEKQGRKAVGAVPVAGSAVTGFYTLGRAIYKSVKGVKGKERGQKAADLARHLLSHNCGLAQAIVAELYSYEEMVWLLEQESPKVVELLMRKMAST